ncbi:MAG: tetratricopeptide repeat protein, partial [Aquincola sp.]|nr:tetratricopeptide repeat protein [Aquincola sp.]
MTVRLPSRPWIVATLILLGAALAATLWVLRSTHVREATAPPAAAPAHPLKAEQLEHSIAEMSERVKTNPDDASAWAMLAHSYDMLGRFAEAKPVYARLVELRPDDPQVLVDAADSLAQAQGRKVEGEPMKLVQRALALDANNLKALSLAGTEAFDRRDFDAAIGYWERARAQVKDAALAKEVDTNIAAARSARERATAGQADAVGGTISLAAKLKSRIAPGDTVFVFARPADGSRMPVALMRRRAEELPFEFRLDDSMAMVPQARMSLQSKVIVGARISRRG